MDAETHLLHIVELLNWRADQLEGSLSELKRDLNASGADSEVVSTISKSRKHVEVLRMDIEKELEPEAEM
mgnify:CR=1 FL=1|jgi:hypothetical protein